MASAFLATEGESIATNAVPTIRIARLKDRLLFTDAKTGRNSGLWNILVGDVSDVVTTNV
jgi:hypothetical protein